MSFRFSYGDGLPFFLFCKRGVTLSSGFLSSSSPVNARMGSAWVIDCGVGCGAGCGISCPIMLDELEDVLTTESPRSVSDDDDDDVVVMGR